MSADVSAPFAGVLTGDFIASRRQSDDMLESSMDVLRNAARDVAGDAGQDHVFQRHRGDGWQLYLPEAGDSLRAALRLLAALRQAEALPTRIAIGVGPAILPADHDLAAARGEAFRIAGDVLDGLDRADRLGLPPLPPAYAALTLFLDHEARGWTRTQAEALFFALRKVAPNHDDIAQRTGVTRQAIQSRLSGTALEALRAACDAFETDIATLRADAASG